MLKITESNNNSNTVSIRNFDHMTEDILEVVNGYLPHISIAELVSNIRQVHNSREDEYRFKQESELVRQVFKDGPLVNLKDSSEYEDHEEAMRIFFNTKYGIFGNIRNHDTIAGMYLVYSNIGDYLIGDDGSVFTTEESLDMLASDIS